jgi:hypothetical protein
MITPVRPEERGGPEKEKSVPECKSLTIRLTKGSRRHDS